jgi:hypothetical protein
MPRIAYITKNFKRESQAIIAYANQIVASYAEQGLTLSLRQLYYRFISADLMPNTEKSYSRLGGIINDARLAGLIDWNAIEDRGRNLIRRSHWNSPADIMDTCARSFAIDKWRGQKYRAEIWVEKQALEAVVGQAAEAWDCPYFSCKGYTSQSELWRASNRFREYANNGQRAVVIHLGDHDPSGIDMTRDIDNRANEVFGTPVIIDRIALNMNQIEEYDPPPNPAKVTDSRFESYAAEYGDESWELDALEPATLNELIQERIKHYLDEGMYEERLVEEAEGRELLQQVADTWDDVVACLQGETPKPQTTKVKKLAAEIEGKNKRIDELTETVKLMTRTLEDCQVFLGQGKKKVAKKKRSKKR